MCGDDASCVPSAADQLDLARRLRPNRVMRGALRLGQLGGIEIRIDHSWLFIFVLLTWSLTVTFTGWHPDWTLLTTLLTAVAATLLFFGSVLAHELAHSFVARAYGLPARSITLHMFGGVSNIEREPPSPSSELLISLVGPITSFGLGIAMTIIGTAAAAYNHVDTTVAPVEAARSLGPISTLLLWLGPVNIVLGVFNLLPGLPLDGGRVLRAILWKASGDVRSATRTSAFIGQLLGWGLVISGIFMFFGFHVPFFGRGGGSGLWLVLLGWFLRAAAVASYRSSILEELMDGVHVADLMRRSGPWLPGAAPLARYAEDILWRGEERAYPVFENGRFVGLVSPSDVRAGSPDDWNLRLVRDAMTPITALEWTTPETNLLDALR
jgi:Zn-dependent protease